jgi:hypothetical protein
MKLELQSFAPGAPEPVTEQGTTSAMEAESLRESVERPMRRLINHCNLKCSMSEGSVDKIVSAIHLMMKGSSKTIGLDFSEIVRQFLCDLTIPERVEFWNELRALHPQQGPNLSTINSSDLTSMPGKLDGNTTKAGSIQ